MAGRSTSEEMDAFDDVTPDRPVSIYDLDENLPTRAQSSAEIAEYQRQLREKRAEVVQRAEPAQRTEGVKAFRPPTDSTPSPSAPPQRGSSGSSARPIPRESGPVPIDRLRVPPPMAPRDHELEDALADVAATLAKLPPAPRVPNFDPPPRTSLESIRTAPRTLPPAPRRSRAWTIAAAIIVLMLAAGAVVFYALARH